MKVVYNWLKDFVDLTATPQDLASRLALSAPIASATTASPAKSAPFTNFR